MYKFLNVDDREESLYHRTRTLRSAGFTVLEAKIGTDTIRIISEEHPQVVLLDIHLPDLNDVEVCSRLKANPMTATVQVLHVSATAVTENLQAMALESGADGYLIEPVDPAVLIAAIRALIRQCQKQEDLRLVKVVLERERTRTTFARNAANYGVWEWNVANGEFYWCEALYAVFGL